LSGFFVFTLSRKLDNLSPNEEWGEFDACCIKQMVGAHWRAPDLTLRPFGTLPSTSLRASLRGNWACRNSGL